MKIVDTDERHQLFQYCTCDVLQKANGDKYVLLSVWQVLRGKIKVKMEKY